MRILFLCLFLIRALWPQLGDSWCGWLAERKWQPPTVPCAWPPSLPPIRRPSAVSPSPDPKSPSQNSPQGPRGARCSRGIERAQPFGADAPGSRKSLLPRHKFSGHDKKPHRPKPAAHFFAKTKRPPPRRPGMLSRGHHHTPPGNPRHIPAGFQLLSARGPLGSRAAKTGDGWPAPV